jgi:hypothetical protein
VREVIVLDFWKDFFLYLDNFELREDRSGDTGARSGGGGG